MLSVLIKERDDVLRERDNGCIEPKYAILIDIQGRPGIVVTKFGFTFLAMTVFIIIYS